MAKKQSVQAFRVIPDKKLKLAKVATRLADRFKSKADYETQLSQFHQKISSFQERLYADGRYAVLLMFQGMDTSGKDGAIEHVLSGVNPQGCTSYSFKTPTSEELHHDYLWRAVLRLPRKGNIGIFNRSYYEELLVPRVHPEVLDAQRLPEECIPSAAKLWKRRCEDISQFEDYLRRNGTRTIKFYLHISEKEQKARLLKRLEDENKQWKVSAGDFEERKYWAEYMAAYEDMLPQTSTKEHPWYLIPADDKKNARLLISEILLSEIESIPVTIPKMNRERKDLFERLREKLV